MQFRKIAALAGSALMAGMTLAGAAMAANVANVGQLTNLVSVTDHTVSFPLFVVGADASSADVAGAIDVAVRLAGEAAATKTIETTTGASADGITFRTEINQDVDKTRDVELSSNLWIRPVEYGGRTASFLKTGTLTYNGTEYKYYEMIGGPFNNTDAAKLIYDTTGDFSDQYKNLAFQTTANLVQYKLVFETPLPLTDSLKGKTITFLGKSYTITKVATDEIDLSASGSEVTVAQGSTATVGDYTVEVKYVGRQGTNTVADIKVTDASGNSDEQIVAVGTTEYFNIGGTSVPVFVKNAIEGYSATVLVGKTSYKLKNGEELEGNENFYVTFDKTTGGDLNAIIIKYKPAHTGFSGDTPALGKGDAITFLDNYFELKNMGPEERKYVKITAAPVTTDFNSDGTQDNGIKVTADSKVIEVPSYGYVDTLYVWYNSGVKYYYKNSTGKYADAGSGPFKITLTDGTVEIQAHAVGTSGDMVVNITEPTLYVRNAAESFYIEYSVTGNGQFGDITDDYGANSTSAVYVSYMDDATGTTGTAIPLATNDTTPQTRTGFISYYGTKLDSVSTTGATLEVPKSQVYYDLILGREGGSTSGTTYKEVIPIKTDVVKLDTEVTDADKSNYDLVVVGGPAVNRLAAELMGKTYPAYGADSGIPENAALVKVFQDAFATGKVAVLIAGWSASDTDLACNAIQQDKLVGQTGTAVKISGTVSSPVIEEYTE